jgi:hypothetical protein
MEIIAGPELTITDGPDFSLALLFGLSLLFMVFSISFIQGTHLVRSDGTSAWIGSTSWWQEETTQIKIADRGRLNVTPFQKRTKQGMRTRFGLWLDVKGRPAVFCADADTSDKAMVLAAEADAFIDSHQPGTYYFSPFLAISRGGAALALAACLALFVYCSRRIVTTVRRDDGWVSVVTHWPWRTTEAVFKLSEVTGLDVRPFGNASQKVRLQRWDGSTLVLGHIGRKQPADDMLAGLYEVFKVTPSDD